MIVRAKTLKGLSWAGRIAVLSMAALVLPLAPIWAQKSKADQPATEQRKLAETVGSTDRQTIALKQQIAEEHLAYIRRELLEVQSQKRKAQARLNAQGKTSASEVSEAEINRRINQDPVVAFFTAKLAEDEERLNSESRRIRAIGRRTGVDPTMLNLKNDIATSRKSLDSKRAALRSIAIQQLEDQKKRDQVTKSDGIEQELAMLDDLEKQLRHEIESVTTLNQSEAQRGQRVDPQADAVVEDRITEDLKTDPELAVLNKEIDEARGHLDHTKQLARQPHDPARVAAERQLSKLSKQHEKLWKEKHDQLLALLTKDDDKDKGKDDKEEKTRDAAEHFQEQLKDLIEKLGEQFSPVTEEIRKALDRAVGEVHKSLEKESLSVDDLRNALEKSQEELRKSFESGGPVDKELREAIEKSRKELQDALDRGKAEVQDQVETLRQRSRELTDRAREDLERAKDDVKKGITGPGEERTNRNELEAARKEIRDLEQQLRRSTRRREELERRESRRNAAARRERNPNSQPAQPPREPAVPATPARPAQHNFRRPQPPNRPAPGAGRRGPQGDNDRRLQELEEKMTLLLKELQNLKKEKTPKERGDR